MGGSAFSSFPNPPYTPRMPPDIYERVKSKCHAALRELFICVATPIPGPEKKDHGDLDVLVALERRFLKNGVSSNPHDLMGTIQCRLDAEYAIIHPSGTFANMAIRWPEECEQGTESKLSCHNTDSDIDNCGCKTSTKHQKVIKYVQVDIRICSDVDQLCWSLFKHAHGDIWNILGSTIRPYGLTVDETALWLRIPEIEKFDRNKAKVFLTKDPVEIIHFLGMKVDGFWDQPFKSVDQFFNYVSTCRFFSSRPLADEDGHVEYPAMDNPTTTAEVIRREAGKGQTKANDRKRMKCRPIFRRWINEFIPSLRAQMECVSRDPVRSITDARVATRNEAFARFLLEPEYKRTLREWRRQRQELEMKKLVNEMVSDLPNPHYRGCLISAMRKIILENDKSYGIQPPTSIMDADGLYDENVVRKFIQEHWRDVGEAAWTMQQQKAREAMARKEVAKNSIP